MNSLECCPNTPDLFSGSPEPQQPPQATATAVIDLEQQAKAFARQLAAKAIEQGYQPTHLHVYTDATGQPLYRKTRAKHPTWDSLTPEQQKATATAAGANGSKWIRAFHHDGAAFIAKEPTFTGGKPLYRLHDLMQCDAGQAVVVVEGEQKADYLCSLGMIATTSGGKSSANVTDWQPLAGRNIVIWRDNDESGQYYQDTVIQAVSLLGCGIYAIDVAQLGLPDRGDVIDFVRMRGEDGEDTTAADIMSLPLVKIEPPAQPPMVDEPATDVGDGIPEGHLVEPMAFGGGRFEVLPNGLYFVEKDKDGGERETFVSSSILVKAKTRNDDGRSWGRLLEWRDAENRLHRWAMPMELLQGDGSEVRRELADRGVQIHPNKSSRDLLTIYLQSYPTELLALCVERLGWCNGAYVMPDRIIGESSQAAELIVYQTPSATPPTFKQKGTAQQWRDNVAVLAGGNSRLLFSVSLAFAPPLLQMANEVSGGFHLRGTTSTGKSTAQIMACSVWGKPESYKQTWNTTANGLEAIACMHNDGLLVLDEIKQADPRTIGTTVYMLGNEKAKNRMSKNLSARPAKIFRLLFLSSGELSLADMIQSGGGRVYGGQELRLADIPADTGSGHGVFDQLHHTDNGAALSRLICNQSGVYYGAVGVAWLEYVTSNQIELAAHITRTIDQWMLQHMPTAAGGQIDRVARRFALVAVAGELATDAGLTGWSKGEAAQAAAICFNAWLESFGGVGNHEERAILAHVKAFFEAHGSSRFESMTAERERIPNRVGYIQQKNGQTREYLVFAEAFKNEVCSGYDYRQVTKVLISHGILVPDKEGKGSQPKRVPDTGKIARLYVINADSLF